MLDTVVVQRELFRRLFDAAPDPIIITNEQGLITLVNTETERKFGYTTAELIEQPLEILIPKRFQREHVHRRDRYAKDPKTRPMGMGQQLFASRKDGTEFPVEISLSPLRTADSLLVISIVRDITERKQAEADLREKASQLERANFELGRSNTELEQFAYIASHDLQEPLRSIAGSCQLLQKRYGDKLDEAGQEFIEFAVDGAKRMQQLINDLLVYSRVTTKGQEPKTTDLQQVLDKVLSNLKSATEESGATVTHDVLPTLKVDGFQIMQLLQNLVSNSLKFKGERRPQIHIGAQEEQDHWQFSIKDNGIGIDPKYFDRIFVIFKRLHTRDEYPGTGIGLATCKKIVERHGGTIWLESHPNQGTTFYFTLSK